MHSFTDRRLWTGPPEPQTWRIVPKTVHAPSLLPFAAQRSVVTGCLRPSRPFQNASISQQDAALKAELLTPSAAFVEADTRQLSLPRGQQIEYLEDLVARLMQTSTFTGKVRPHHLKKKLLFYCCFIPGFLQCILEHHLIPRFNLSVPLPPPLPHNCSFI